MIVLIYAKLFFIYSEINVIVCLYNILCGNQGNFIL